jgi:hypothetical protein
MRTYVRGIDCTSASTFVLVVPTIEEWAVMSTCVRRIDCNSASTIVLVVLTIGE